LPEPGSSGTVSVEVQLTLRELEATIIVLLLAYWWLAEHDAPGLTVNLWLFPQYSQYGEVNYSQIMLAC